MNRARHVNRSGGFTLLEVLVVMLLMGLLIGMVSFVPLGTSSQQARREAERFATLVELLRQQAVERNQIYGVQIDAQRYAVQMLDGDGHWQPAQAFRPQILQEGLHLRIDLSAAKPSVTGNAVAPRAIGRQPDLLVLPSDETSPFKLWLENDKTTLLTISSDGLDEVQIESAK